MEAMTVVMIEVVMTATRVTGTLTEEEMTGIMTAETTGTMTEGIGMVASFQSYF